MTFYDDPETEKEVMKTEIQVKGKIKKKNNENLLADIIYKTE